MSVAFVGAMHHRPACLARLGLWILLAATGHGLAPAQTQAQHDQLWSSEFAPPGVGGPVHALLPFQGDLVVGGEFQHVRGHVTPNVARWNGAVFAPMGAGLPGAVRALCLHNASLYAGGEFGVARWTGAAWVHLPGLTLFFSTPQVHALASHQGDLWVGGEFDQAGAVQVHGLARWTGTTWSAPPGGHPGHTLQEPRVLALAPSANGRLYAGGEFQSIGGVGASNVAEYGTTWRALHAGTDRTVRSLAEFQGALHVGGDFDHAGGTLASGIARWTGTSWQALGSGLTGRSGFVQVFGLGTYAGSLFAAGNLLTAGGATANGIARWDGTAWSNLGQGIANTPGFEALPRVAVEWRNQLLVGGDFTRFGSSLAPGQALVGHNLAAWDGAAWSTVSPGLGTDGDVLAMTAWNGGVVVGGRFPLAGGQYGPGLAWLRDGEFRWLGSFDGPVLDAVEWQGDLVVTGQFHSVGSVFANQIARFDGQQWHPLGVGAGEYCVAVYQNDLYAGGIGAPRRWNGTTWQTFGTPIYGAVTAMVVHQGALFLGGIFNGVGAMPNLARWDGATMTGVGLGVNSYGVGALCSFGNDLIVGGTFTTAGGLPARNIAAWDGAAFRALGAGVPGSSVNALAVLGNTLWVGGDLGTIAGAPQHRYVALWDGATWSLPGRGPTSAVLTLHADPVRQQVYAGGWYYECSGRPAWNLCRYDALPGWQDLGFGSTAGGARARLRGTGLLQAPGSVALQLEGAPGNGLGMHVAGFSRSDLPLFGAVLVPSPLATSVFVADALGGTSLAVPITAPLPLGTQLFWQCFALDPQAPQGVVGSNAIRQIAW